MKIAYIDCFSGISGDMLLGAIVDAGVGIEEIREDLAKLNIPDLKISASETHRAGMRAVAISIPDDHHGPLRTLRHIEKILDESSLDKHIRDKAASMFRALAEVEGHIHDRKPEDTHFHELSGLDTIADVVGALCGLRRLKVEKVYASNINVGSGTVHCAHGVFPVPAPATAALLKGTPAFSQFDGELTTPTGALLATSLASKFGSMPPMRIRAIGCGAGCRDLPHPNILRLLIGDSIEEETGDVIEVETNVDDMNPQAWGPLFEKVLAAGALDVFLTHVQMKKNRPGIRLTAICTDASFRPVTDILLRETTTLGLRHIRKGRVCLERRSARIDTPHGPLRIKIALVDGRVRSASPEFDDCARIARETGAPLPTVIKDAEASAAGLFPAGSPDPGDDE